MSKIYFQGTFGAYSHIAALSINPKAKTFLRFTKNSENIYHHIGIYCYSTRTLDKFVKLKQSKNEIENKLEQLRALDNNITINVALAKSSSIGIDTKEDYLAIKKIM